MTFSKVHTARIAPNLGTTSKNMSLCFQIYMYVALVYREAG